MSRRRWLAPEVVQTSAMDCGPAALKCLLEGHGRSASYGRLREACRTDVDGTSIDSLEDIARSLGLEADQVMAPLDHLLMRESESLPAIVVIRQSDGLLHFVVVWRAHGPWVQLMDPAVGRRWVSRRRFLEQVYVHEHPVSQEQWCVYADSDLFRRPLRLRLKKLVGAGASERLEKELDDAAALEAAVRLAESLVEAKSLRRGSEAHIVVRALLAETEKIPDVFWSARAIDGECVEMRGAVIVRARGAHAAGVERREELCPELTAALTEPEPRPLRGLTRFLGLGALGLFSLASMIVFASIVVVIEALLFRGALEIGIELERVTDRLSAMSLLISFGVALTLVELGVAGGVRSLGRQLELRLRMAIAHRVPRLADQYFRSRPISDMAERSHALHSLRALPRVSASLLGSGVSIVVTAVAIAWIHPPGALIALVAALLAIGLPLSFLPVLGEIDLRLRTHNGALSRFLLDSLLGATAVRAHAGERAMLRQQEGLLTEWWTSCRERVLWVVRLEVLQAVTGFGAAFGLLASYSASSNDPTRALLLAYWALSLPVLGEEMAARLRSLPLYRNLAGRLFEPLSAPEAEAVESHAEGAEPAEASSEGGVHIRFDGVTVRASGHTILEAVDLEIASGEHVAIVGGSGAGKSSLVGSLLGWHRCHAGRLLIDGHLLDEDRLIALRSETAWVDPAVLLWNRSLLENLSYGSRAGRLLLDDVLESSGLLSVLEHLPKGLQTSLGESGRCVSGGQGQKVRHARALARENPRLVVLDEPFRGLDRDQRRELLASARSRWSDATLLFVTHDIELATRFDRVLVIEGGRLVEEGRPAVLSVDPGSRLSRLLDAEKRLHSALFEQSEWRRWRIEDRTLTEIPRGES